VLAGFNDLATRFPAVAAQWHPTRNGDLTPDQVSAGGSKKVWWLCDEGHEWEALVSGRTSGGHGCPHRCGRKLRAEHPTSLRSGTPTTTVTSEQTR